MITVVLIISVWIILGLGVAAVIGMYLMLYDYYKALRQKWEQKEVKSNNGKE